MIAKVPADATTRVPPSATGGKTDGFLRLWRATFHPPATLGARPQHFAQRYGQVALRAGRGRLFSPEMKTYSTGLTSVEQNGIGNGTELPDACLKQGEFLT